MTVDELVDAWRANMEDASKDETAREHWLRSQLNAAYAKGYARAREQAAGIADEETGGWVSSRIRAMKDEGAHE